MKAVAYDRYGKAGVLHIAEISTPKITRGEVLVRVTRAALNPKDVVVRSGKFKIVSGKKFPKQSGLDLAGVVADSESAHFSSGSRVFGCLGEWTALRGTLAEFVRVRETEIANLPDAMTDEDGAAIALAGLTALQALRDVAKLGANQRILINGATGGVGSLAIQIARILGAEAHTVSSEANTAFCKELGAHSAWSYPAHAWRNEPPFDVIFDVFGNLRFQAERKHLAPRGVFVSTVPTPARLIRNVLSRISKKRERLVIIEPRREELTELATWMTTGVLRAVIDSRFELSSLQEAFARLESKRTRGKIIVEMT